MDMAGRTQSEAVKLLRETSLGGVVSLLVSRIVVENDEGAEKEEPREMVNVPTIYFAKNL